jgi:hypothetical protein
MGCRGSVSTAFEQEKILGKNEKMENLAAQMPPEASLGVSSGGVK